MGLLAELTWANLIALLTVVSGILATYWLNANNRKTTTAAARKDVAQEWEAFCAKQQASIDQLVKQLERSEIARANDGVRFDSRLKAMEDELEQTRNERDEERRQRILLERKVFDLDCELAAFRKQAKQAQP